MKKLRSTLRKFFFPPHDSPRWLLILPYAFLGVITLLLLIGGAYAWDYTNSSYFCGTSCHTMPPEFAAYETSPHAQVACVECHIGREFIGNQIFRKAGDIRHIVAMTFNTYEYPIFAGNMRPARETCEKCHTPEKFSDDSFRVLTLFQNDVNNTPESIYLTMKTGGGAKVEGLGKGIHWHIVNKVLYYATDFLEQNIPYIRVYNDDGSVTEYKDASSDIDPTAIAEGDLKEMDCITCHNRITHGIKTPTESMDSLLSRAIIEVTIPGIHDKGVEVLSESYTSQEEGLTQIAALDNYYQSNYPNYYRDHKADITNAIAAIQETYKQTVFLDQQVDWSTHPNNLGHIDFPGCFRCHDGKHLDDQQQAIRLECNLCHSIPVVASAQDLVATIEISRGPEPTSHLNANWISLHNSVLDGTCTTCHTITNPGGTSNTSFCSNSACHGTVFQFAGFDAPALRQVLQSQINLFHLTPPVTEVPNVDNPTFENDIQPMLAVCIACHNSTAPSAKLDLSSYEGIMKGGKDGVVIVPGDSANSLFVQIQSATHYVNLTPEQLTLIKNWIDAGAPEK